MRAVLLVALVGCSSSPCGDGVAASQLTIGNGDLTVIVTTASYSLEVDDAAGNVILHDGSLGWTTGTFGISRAAFQGYFSFDPHFDPWRAGLRVTAATQTDSELDVTLDGCIHVRHVLRDGALRVEAHRDGDAPRAWQIAFPAALQAVSETYQGLSDVDGLLLRGFQSNEVHGFFRAQFPEIPLVAVAPDRNNLLILYREAFPEREDTSGGTRPGYVLYLDQLLETYRVGKTPINLSQL